MRRQPLIESEVGVTMNRTAFLFPGHGSYVAGVLRELGSEVPQVRATFDSVDATCVEAGVAPVERLVRSESAPSVRELLRSSPGSICLAIFGAAVATFKILTDAGVRPAVMLGHSFAEITALTCAGAYSVEDGARILHARNRALRELALTETGMLAVELSAERAQALVDAVGDRHLQLACVNAPRQSVFSGTVETLRLVQAITDQLGVRSTPVAVPHASHNSLLAAAVPEFRKHVEALPRRPLTLPVYSPVERRHYGTEEELAPIIAGNLLRRVLFADALRVAHADSVEIFVQCGPSGTLTRMAEQTVPDVSTFAPLAKADGAEARLTQLIAVLTGHEPAVQPLRVVPRSTVESTAEPSAPSVPSSSHAAAAARSSVPRVSDSPPDRAQLSAQLRDLYASSLGFPDELFTEDVEFEADLGIDSVKRTELAGHVVRLFNLAAEAAVGDYTTFGQVVDMVADELRSRSSSARV